MQEFVALRAEIGIRTTAQNALTSITVVAVGGIGSFAFSGTRASVLVLLVLPPLVVATGLQWLDHAHAIYKVGSYIKTKLWPSVCSELGANAPSYEVFALQGQARWRERSVLIIPFVILFIAPGVGSLGYLAFTMPNPLAWLAWCVELAAVAYFVISWISFFREAISPEASNDDCLV